MAQYVGNIALLEFHADQGGAIEHGPLGAIAPVIQHHHQGRNVITGQVASSLALISKEPSPVSTNGFTLAH